MGKIKQILLEYKGKKTLSLIKEKLGKIYLKDIHLNM